MELLQKLDKVEIKTIDRFPPADMEYCRRAEKDYQDAYNIYSEFSYIVEEINESISALGDKLYINKIDDNKDKVYKCNKEFIRKICRYFREKYSVSVENPEWETVEENHGYKEKNENYDAVPLKYILDSVYEQMGGMSFEEKAFNELKEGAKEALTDYRGKSKYFIQGKKLIVEKFYNSHIYYMSKKYKATVESKHRFFFTALTHFEYGWYEISQKYGFLCNNYQISESSGVYDKHFLSSTVINTVRLYKNGKVEIDFKDYRAVKKFMDKYFPGVPQAAAA